MVNEKTWRQIVEKAELYLALGQVEHYLSGNNDGDYPWPYAVSCEPGGSHRLDISTGVWFKANHPSGLKFKWSFDIEPYSASGKSSYEIDALACHVVLKKLPDECRVDFRKYLHACADAVEKNALQYREGYEREIEVVRKLRSC